MSASRTEREAAIRQLNEVAERFELARSPWGSCGVVVAFSWVCVHTQTKILIFIFQYTVRPRKKYVGYTKYASI